MGKTHWLPPGRRSHLRARLNQHKAIVRSRCGRPLPLAEHSDTPTCLHCAPHARAHAMKVNEDHGGHVELVEPTLNSDDYIEGHPAWV